MNSYQGMPPAHPNKDAVPKRRFRATDYEPLIGHNDQAIPPRQRAKSEKITPVNEYGTDQQWRLDLMADLYADTGDPDTPTVPFGKGSRGA